MTVRKGIQIKKKREKGYSEHCLVSKKKRCWRMKEGIQPIGHYGQRIRTLRERHQLDQHTLAELTKMTLEMIRCIENSIVDPSFLMIERLVRALQIPADHLLRHIYIWSSEVICQHDRTTLIDIPSS